MFAATLTTEEITERRRKLMELRHELEWKHFPTADLPSKPALLALAEQDAIDYLESMFARDHAMTKSRDGVLPRSKIEVRMPPGAATPRSDIYEQVGPRGGRTGAQAVSAKDKPLPPTTKAGQGWTLVKPAAGRNK